MRKSSKKKTTTRRKASKGVKITSYKPLRSTKSQIKNSIKYSKYYIRHSIGSNVRKYLSKILSEVKKGNDSKKKYSKKGVYTPSRRKIHNKIINAFLSKDRSTKSPDVYVFGGPTASGKTSILARFVKEKTVTVNNDDIKTKLTKYDPSHFKKYPLIHAAYLHEESSDIEKELVNKVICQKKDVILDRTLGSYIKNKKLLLKMKKEGYRVTILGTNLPPHIAIIRASTRFLRRGRYVPLDLMGEKGNKINSNVFRMSKQKFVRKARVFDTRKHKVKLMYKRG